MWWRRKGWLCRVGRAAVYLLVAAPGRRSSTHAQLSGRAAQVSSVFVSLALLQGRAELDFLSVQTSPLVRQPCVVHDGMRVCVFLRFFASSAPWTALPVAEHTSLFSGHTRAVPRKPSVVLKFQRGYATKRGSNSSLFLHSAPRSPLPVFPLCFHFMNHNTPRDLSFEQCDELTVQGAYKAAGGGG